MPKSNRRRKQERARRRASAAQRHAGVRRRQILDQMFREAERRVALIHDPSTPVEQVAALIRHAYDDGPVIPGLAAMLREQRGSVEDVVAIAEAMRAGEAAQGQEPPLSALTFGAQVAHLTGDYARARRLLDSALERTDEPESRVRLAAHLRLLGRTADALEFVAAYVTDPVYESAVTVHGSALEDAWRHLSGEEPQGGGCRCGSGNSWSACCRQREADAVERFLDRSGLYALRTAIVEYLPRSRYDKQVAERVVDWLAMAGVEIREPDEEPLHRLAIEHAWLNASLDEEAADDEDNLLTALAADPATKPEIVAAAKSWRDHVRYGLWQVTDPTPAPGLWCTDVVTGQELYLAFAPEQTERLPRWAVLLGAAVPLDGAWRATGSLIQVSPGEADAMCETIQAAAEVVVGDLSGRPDKRAQERLRQPVPFGRAAPHNVYAYQNEPELPHTAVFLSKVTGSLLPRLVAELHRSRATPPTLTNTDGDELCVITARVTLGHVSAVASRLAAHLDFEADPEDPGRWNWLGRDVPAGQRAAMLAEVRAQLRSEGHTDVNLQEAAGPNRWVRGQLELHGDELTVQVNSRERLERLLAILDRIGAQPTVVDQTRVDPAQDLPWPPGHRPVPGGLAPPAEGFEKQWLDEPVPALGGRTPRRAASGSERQLLEGRLREFEYDADLLAHEGGRGIDTAWLRDQLGMSADPWA